MNTLGGFSCQQYILLAGQVVLQIKWKQTSDRHNTNPNTKNSFKNVEPILGVSDITVVDIQVEILYIHANKGINSRTMVVTVLRCHVSLSACVLSLASLNVQ